MRQRIAFVLAVGATTAVSVATALAATHTSSTGNLGRTIPDGGVLVQKLKVEQEGKVKDVNALVRLDHSYDGDLVIWLQGPGGVATTLMSQDGGDGEDLGTGPNNCSGNPTKFDDEAAEGIGSGSAPFDGSFQPNDFNTDPPPERGLVEFDGHPATGTWKLFVGDSEYEDKGKLGCFKLQIKT